MLLKFVFTRLGPETQVRFMRKRGIVLGKRWKEGRQIYIYMFRTLFAEVLFLDDNPDKKPEKVTVISGLDRLNEYLEKDTREMR
jgi:hypothetical protein